MCDSVQAPQAVTDLQLHRPDGWLAQVGLPGGVFPVSPSSDVSAGLQSFEHLPA